MLSTLVLMAMAVAAYVGFYHLVLYLKRRKDRFNLTFAGVCLSLVSYDAFSAGLFSVSSAAEGAFWQRGQITSLASITAIVFVFVHDLVGQKMSRWVKVTLAVIGALAVINFFTPWGVVDGVSDVKTVVWMGVTYHESALGLGATLLFVITIGGMLYCLLLLNRHRRERRYLKTIFVLVLPFFVTAINDICVSSGLYPSIYIVEYGFFTLILGMAHSLLTKSVQVHEAVEELSVRLEDRVRERTLQLEEAHKVLVEEAHRAGMATIATGVLHNMGNLLNSVNTSTGLLLRNVNKPAVRKLERANTLLRENIDKLKAVHEGDDRLLNLFDYYLMLEQPFGKEHESIAHNVQRLQNVTESMCQLVAAQQGYADSGSYSEEVDLTGVLNDALTMQQTVLDRYQIEVQRQFCSVPTIEAQKSKLLHVFMNLIKNAVESLEGTPNHPPKLILEVVASDRDIHVVVEDNGEGIPVENLGKVFSYGFTTKDGAHGFGLHSSANYVTEMGGTITARSEGVNKGAVFQLRFPTIDDTRPSA